MRAFLLAAACLLAGAESVVALTWSHFDPLVGEWRGSGTESGAAIEATQTWDWIYDGRFLRLTTRLVVIDENGGREVRENVGYMSYDADRDAFVFRQFFSLGYVATYDVLVMDDGRVIDFGERAAESAGDFRARMVITFTNDETYELTIELAAPGQEYGHLQTLTMQR